MTNFTNWRSIIDGSGVIPDSALYQWQTPISGLSGGDPVNTWPANIGSSDIDGNSLTYSEGNFTGVDSVEATGSGSYADTGITTGFPDLDSAFSIGISIKTTDTDRDYLFGVQNSSDGTRFLSRIESDGVLQVSIQDQNGSDDFTVESTKSFADGNEVLIGISKESGLSGDIYTLYENASEINSSITQDQSVSNVTDLDIPFSLFAFNSGGSISGSISLDCADFVIADEKWDQQQWSQYYDSLSWT